MKEKTHWVMDFETLSNCFIGVFEDVKSENKKIFVCHESRNDIFDFITFLEHNIAYNITLMIQPRKSTIH